MRLGYRSLLNDQKKFFIFFRNSVLATKLVRMKAGFNFFVFIQKLQQIQLSRFTSVKR